MTTVRATTPNLQRISASKRFTVAPTIDGYEVVDSDGRSVTDAYETATMALKLSARLNEAASSGKAALRRVLGALEDEEIFLATEALETLAS